MATLAACVIFFLVCVAVRVAPSWRVRHQGCDSYYFLLTAEAFRRQRRVPVRLPGYFLAETPEQTYPPGFTVFLGLLPEGLVRGYYWLINPVLDAANLALLFVFVDATFGLAAAGAAAALYLVVPDLQTENASLTSRALANLLLSGYVIGVAEYLGGGGGAWLLPPLAASLLLLLTHKLTTQFLLVLSAGLSALTLRVEPFAAFAAAVAVALVAFRRLYLTVLRGHYDVVTFWHRHFKSRGEHMVYDSPLYARPERSLRRSSMSSQPKWVLARYALACNPLLLALPLTFGFAAGGPLTWVLWCCGPLCLLTAFATLFVPALRQFGQGHRYAKMSAFPLAALSAAALTSPGPPAVKAGLAAVGLLCVVKTVRNSLGTWRAAGRVSAVVVDADMRKAFDYINEHALDYFFCLDVHPSEALAYHCRKHVLWGNHHWGFNTMLVDFLPTLQRPLECLVRKYGIRYLFINEQYVEPADLRLSSELRVWHSGRYSIYDVRHMQREAGAAPGREGELPAAAESGLETSLR